MQVCTYSLVGALHFLKRKQNTFSILWESISKSIVLLWYFLHYHCFSPFNQPLLFDGLVCTLPAPHRLGGEGSKTPPHGVCFTQTQTQVPRSHQLNSFQSAFILASQETPTFTLPLCNSHIPLNVPWLSVMSLVPPLLT